MCFVVAGETVMGGSGTIFAVRRYLFGAAGGNFAAVQRRQFRETIFATSPRFSLETDFFSQKMRYARPVPRKVQSVRFGYKEIYVVTILHVSMCKCDTFWI